MPYTDFREELIAGTTLPLRLSVTRGGVAQDISGFSGLTLIGKVSLRDADDDAVFTLIVMDGLTIINASTGIVDARVPPDTTLAIVKTTRLWCGFRALEAPDTWMPATGFIIVQPSPFLSA